MNSQEIQILNSLVTYAAENMPGGLGPEEHQVAFQVAIWAIDGVPIRPVCPHCNTVQPRDEGRLEWLEHHLDSKLHRIAWSMKSRFRLP